MADVYTTLLFRYPSLASGFTFVPPPPSGFRWVITDMDACVPDGSPGTNSNTGLVVLDGDDVAFWIVGDGRAVDGTSYQWRGRQVVDDVDQVVLLNGGAAWSIRATGFVLTLP